MPDIELFTNNPNEEVVLKWVEALESGEFKQARRVLYDGEGYCCLGVACKVCGLEPEPGLLGFKFEGFGTFLPPEIVQKIGLTTSTGLFGRLSLTGLNDGAFLRFEQIAQVIRIQFELQFGRKLGQPAGGN